MKRGNQASSSENPHTAPTEPKSPCVICKGDHYHRDCPCIPQILRDWSPRLHNPVSSTSDDHVENTLSTSESEVSGQKGRYRFPCKLCEGDHAVHRCPFLDEAKRVLDDRPVSPLRLPPGYKKLLPSPSLVENPADTPIVVGRSIYHWRWTIWIHTRRKSKGRGGSWPGLAFRRSIFRWYSHRREQEWHRSNSFRKHRLRWTWGQFYPFLYRRKEVRQSHTRPSIRSHLQAT